MVSDFIAGIEEVRVHILVLASRQGESGEAQDSERAHD